MEKKKTAIRCMVSPPAHYFIAIFSPFGISFTHVLLQLGLADVREAEGEQRLPGSDVQHVVLLAEQQRCVIEDAVHRKSLGRPLLCIWETARKKNHRHTLEISVT